MEVERVRWSNFWQDCTTPQVDPLRSMGPTLDATTKMSCGLICQYSIRSLVISLTTELTIGKYYDLSVGENIGVGRISSMTDQKELLDAAENGGALEFISSLPDALDTVMFRKYSAPSAKTRCELSGGQWQRLALSRAFMRLTSADLLLLDEPSASLDPEAEFRLFKKLKETRHKTTVYISHRFNTVRAATKIMVHILLVMYSNWRSSRMGP